MQTLSQREENVIFSPSSYEDMSKIDKEVVWKKIYDCLKQILAAEFTSEAKRTPTPHKDRIQFACVYCGDSSKDENKKRGNIFPDTMQYHCFNGDCGAHMSIYNFMRDKHMIHNFTIAEQNYLQETSSSSSINLKQIKSALGLETYFSDEIQNLSIERSFLMTKLNLVEIKGSKIEKYLDDRLQKDFNKLAYNPKSKVIHIFNLTKEGDYVVGMQIKTFNKRNPYLTYKITNLHEMLGIFDEKNREMLEKMDYLSNIFGIFQVDLNKPITVFEGPFDSFLFPNAVALCSAKNSLPFEIEGSRYFYDNDDTGREYSIKKIAEGKPVFLWKKYLQDNELLGYDSKIKDLNDLLIFMRKNPKKYTKFADYFSDDKYDMIFV